MAKQTSCENCGYSFTNIFNKSTPLSKAVVELINNRFGFNNSSYCTVCGKSYLKQLAGELSSEKKELIEKIKYSIVGIPILTSPAPNNWDYYAISIVSTQTTTGTGIGTDFTMEINDLFGKGSNTLNNKIMDSINLCKTDLRKQCLDLGGNAIVSTDIDISEVSNKSASMIMVCMAGTAVYIKDLSVLNDIQVENINNVCRMYERLQIINQHEI